MPGVDRIALKCLFTTVSLATPVLLADQGEPIPHPRPWDEVPLLLLPPTRC